jgi:type IV pili sensor histidine kinase/response regulator
LRDVVADWTEHAGYQLVWDASYDFPIRASISVDGDFVEAMTKLFDAYATADRPLLVDIYKEQRLVHVEARGE